MNEKIKELAIAAETMAGLGVFESRQKVATLKAILTECSLTESQINLLLSDAFVVLNNQSLFPPNSLAFFELIKSYNGSIVPYEVIIKHIWGDNPPKRPKSQLSDMITRSRGYSEKGSTAVNVRGKGYKWASIES